MKSKRSSISLSSLGLVAGGLILALGACSAETKPAVEPSVSVPVEVVRASTLPETRVTTGTVRSTTVAPLAAKVMGNVTRVLVDVGQRVRAGEVLVEIDDREGRARTAQASAGTNAIDQAIAAARANADLAASTYRRFAALRERGSVSAQEFDEVAARHASAQSQLQQALAQRAQARAGLTEAETFLSYTQVRSPIAGIVTARMIDPGAQAAPGMPLLTVEDDSRHRVETTIDEELAGSIHEGDTVSVDGRLARVTNIVPAVDPATRSALVKIALPAGSGLRSGSFVRVAFTIGQRSGVTIPSSAIVRTGQLTSVFVVTGGTARMRLVTLGDEHDARVEVLSGIDAGEAIVPKVISGVRDGVKVSS